MSVLDTPEGKELFKQIVLGIDAENFLRSNLGDYITRRMMELNQDAMNGLATADPEDARSIRNFQNEARIPILVLQTIDECIQMGKQAAILDECA